MTYFVRVVVHALDDPKVEKSVRAAMEFGGSAISEFCARSIREGEKEFYVELELGDRRVINRIIQRVEAVIGAAVMAATEPTKTIPRKSPRN